MLLNVELLKCAQNFHIYSEKMAFYSVSLLWIKTLPLTFYVSTLEDDKFMIFILSSNDKIEIDVKTTIKPF